MVAGLSVIVWSRRRRSAHPAGSGLRTVAVGCACNATWPFRRDIPWYRILQIDVIGVLELWRSSSTRASVWPCRASRTSMTSITAWSTTGRPWTPNVPACSNAVLLSRLRADHPRGRVQQGRQTEASSTSTASTTTTPRRDHRDDRECRAAPRDDTSSSQVSVPPVTPPAGQAAACSLLSESSPHRRRRPAGTAGTE